jgi:phosphatidylserine decarboxylase
LPAKSKIYFIDRRSGEKKEEKIYFESSLLFLYNSPVGKLLALLIAHLPFFSKLSGWWQRLPFTKKKIAPFIEKYAIDPLEFEKPPDQYFSFDAFFTRKLKKEARPFAQKAMIPADGRYLLYQNIATCNGFIVKGKKFSLDKLLGNVTLAKNYAFGSMAIARLAPSDYHRFHFPINCTPNEAHLINGPLYSVNPIAVKQNIDLLAENKRMITQLISQNYGNVLFIEIGATNVGSIHQTYLPNRPYNKGDEKGYFSFGGSSIILLFEAGRIQFAKDLIVNSSQHIETLCLLGQPLED